MVLTKRGNKLRLYYVSSFPRKLIDDGFEKKILIEYSCLIEDMHNHNKEDLVGFHLIVPEDNHVNFIAWLKEKVNLDLTDF
ncbi:MAG: hypothetical protein NTY12_00160 [Candidatus Falkowbacteria bacterium]|nr:hypothetical protein [Candidatus Falkowbacteria bacterium]